MARYAYTCQLKEDSVEAYIRAHDSIWPEVEAALSAVGVCNLSIFLSGTTLFLYYEYNGSVSHETAMKRYLDLPRIREWEEVVGCFKVSDDSSGETGFCTLREIYHLN